MRGIRSRLVLCNVLAIGVILASMGIVHRFQLRAMLFHQIDSELKDGVAGITSKHSDQAEPLRHPEGAVLIEHEIPQDKSFFGIVDRRVVNQTGSKIKEVVKGGTDEVSLKTEQLLPKLIPVDYKKHELPPVAGPFDEFGFEQARKGKPFFNDFAMHGRRHRSYSLPVYSGSRLLAIAQDARDMTPVLNHLNKLDASLSTLLPIALIVAGIAGWFLVGSAMRPLRRLIDSAKTLDPDLSSKRLPVVGKDEFAELAITFNEAFDRTAGAFAAQSRAMKQLERFTGDAGHELRTPLGAIKGSVSFLLQNKKTSADVRKSLEIMDRSSDRMARLIDDLLLLAWQDGGHYPLRRDRVALASIVRDALEMLPVPESVEVSVSVSPELELVGDSSGLTRVVANLASNAISFARSRVHITAVQTGTDIDLIVEDDGEGIAPEHLSRLGERFYRPESSRSRESGGTGLGLAIAKSIVEAHGGNLNIESMLGSGTTVTVHLPMDLAQLSEHQLRRVLTSAFEAEEWPVP